MKFTIALYFLLLFSNVIAQANQESLQPQIIDTSEIRVYTSYNEMLDIETAECLQESDKDVGFAFWGFKIGVKKGPNWIVMDQPNFNSNENCSLKLLSVEFMDINMQGRPELILKFKNQIYGNRGGTDLEYLQIWNIDAKALVIENITKEHFYWFSTKAGEGTCERQIEYSSGEIRIGKVKCEGGTENFELVNDTLEGTYILTNGSFKRK